MKSFEETKAEFMKDFLLLLKKYDAEVTAYDDGSGYPQIEMSIPTKYGQDGNQVIEGGEMMLKTYYYHADYDHL